MKSSTYQRPSQYHNQPYLLYGPHEDDTTRNGAVTSSCASRKHEGIQWWTNVISHSLFVLPWTLWRSVWRSGVIKTHTHTQIRDLIHGVQASVLRKNKKYVHVVPLEVSIWLLLVSSVQGPRLQSLKGKPSSEKQEPWVGLRLTRDSRLWGLVWVSESRPVFSSIFYIPSPSFSCKHFD